MTSQEFSSIKIEDIKITKEPKTGDSKKGGKYASFFFHNPPTFYQRNVSSRGLVEVKDQKGETAQLFFPVSFPGMEKFNEVMEHVKTLLKDQEGISFVEPLIKEYETVSLQVPFSKRFGKCYTNFFFDGEATDWENVVGFHCEGSVAFKITSLFVSSSNKAFLQVKLLQANLTEDEPSSLIPPSK